MRAVIAAEGGPERAVVPFGAKDDLPGRYSGRGNEDEWGQRLADILRRIMEADIAVIRREYDRAALVVHPGGREGWSFDHAEAQWMRLRAAFPSAEFRIEHQIGRSDPGQPHRAAVRWSLRGRHEGLGTFGVPTGAEVYIMGFTHAEFGPYGDGGMGAAAGMDPLRRAFDLEADPPASGIARPGPGEGPPPGARGRRRVTWPVAG